MKFWYWYDPPHIKVAGQTYNIKEELKSVGAFWELKTKIWVLPNNTDALETIRKLKIPRRLKVLREAFCHEQESVIYCTEDELSLIDGKECIRRQFCGNCDSYHGPEVGVRRLE